MATSTASAPVKKLPAWPPCAARAPPAPASRPPRANTPERFSPTASISQASAATKAGAVNWKPQPAVTPAWRSPISSPARARKLTSTPAV
ncbi:hypothetical protein ACFQY5_22865 [Paeniroseomonas aquatica]|uniref:hypothetical protein n=1 Tax=Paeniroseomonas aquatica TaxID=373043 RepID=UPI00360F2BA9